MSGADEWNRAMDAIERADAKRARKAALREDHRRWTAEGRDWARYDLEHLTHDRPHGLWDREERFWRCNPPHDCAGFTPRWRARLNHRRSLRMEGHSWLGSDDQWRRLLRPRSFMTRAWRRVKRNQACAALWKELSR